MTDGNGAAENGSGADGSAAGAGEDPPPTCPSCGSARTVPLVHGTPDEEQRARAARGEIVLGGPDVLLDPPDRACRACGYRWRSGGRPA